MDGWMDGWVAGWHADVCLCTRKYARWSRVHVYRGRVSFSYAEWSLYLIPLDRPNE
jgi:hypothetical protein